jgi:acetyl-CoA carboxylase biotin carboxylase subunit
VVSAEGDMERAFAEAQAESKAGFGRPELYVEKYLATPRHVEVQVLGDGKGQAIHLGTRECSIQRRHQKLIEEAPAPSLDGATLSALSEQCADMARDMEYGNAGTFEFLYQDEVFYFIEMNTRIQVEHPVTEMITGIDIVKAQLEIAITGELPVNQGAVNFTGHAIECRINAESMDASSGRIVPCPGLVYDYVVPGGPGIRVDSHLFNGYKVPHHYDSMVAKLIAWGRGRDEALRRIGRALREFQVRGVDTNIAVMSEVIGSTRFRNGDVDTAFLDASGSWLAA